MAKTKKVKVPTSPNTSTEKSVSISTSSELEKHIRSLEADRRALIEERARLQSSETDPSEKPMQEIYNLSNRIIDLTKEITKLRHPKKADDTTSHSSTSNPNVVGIGDVIKVRRYLEEGEDVVTIKLVSVLLSNTNGVDEVSVDAPLGKAVNGKELNKPFTVVVSSSYSYQAVVEAITK